MKSTGEHFGTRESIFQRAIRLTQRRDELSDEEKRRWTELYEYEIAADRGEVTRETVDRVRARTEAYSLMQQPMPTRPLPKEIGFTLYVMLQSQLARWRSGEGEKPKPEEIERAMKFGKPVFESWWIPIEDHLARLDRAISRLNHFGTDDDLEEIGALQMRGNNIVHWVEQQRRQGVLPWLPKYFADNYPLSRTWKLDRATQHQNVLEFWKERRQ